MYIYSICSIYYIYIYSIDSIYYVYSIYIQYISYSGEKKASLSEKYSEMMSYTVLFTEVHIYMYL